MKKRLIISLSILPLLMLVSCSSSPEQQSATPPSPPTAKLVLRQQLLLLQRLQREVRRKLPQSFRIKRLLKRA